MTPREQRISVGGTHVHTWVGGQGEPLLVLHGAGGNRGWRKWMERVAEHYTVWAPTHPGFGASGDAEWKGGIDDLARFYLWWIDVVTHWGRRWAASCRSRVRPRAIRWGRRLRSSIVTPRCTRRSARWRRFATASAPARASSSMCVCWIPRSRWSRSRRRTTWRPAPRVARAGARPTGRRTAGWSSPPPAATWPRGS